MPNGQSGEVQDVEDTDADSDDWVSGSDDQSDDEDTALSLRWGEPSTWSDSRSAV